MTVPESTTAGADPAGFVDAVIAWVHANSPLGHGWSIDPSTVKTASRPDNSTDHEAGITIYYDRVKNDRTGRQRRKHIALTVLDPARFAQTVMTLSLTASTP